MPSLDQHHSATTTKMLLIGQSGMRKTSSLVSLVADGYKLFIQDYDDGLDYFKNKVAKDYPDKLQNVRYMTLRDDFAIGPTGSITIRSSAFTRGTNLLGKWKDDDGKDYGSITSWGSDTVLVIDSLSHMCSSALNKTLALSNRLESHPEIQDWGNAQDDVERYLSILFGRNVKCNVIVMAHMDFIADALGINRGFPRSLGKKLSPKIPTYFNTMLLATEEGMGSQRKNVIRTAPDGTIGLKHTIAEGLPPTLPTDQALSIFFKAARKSVPIAAPAPAPEVKPQAATS